MNLFSSINSLMNIRKVNFQEPSATSLLSWYKFNITDVSMNRLMNYAPTVLTYDASFIDVSANTGVIASRCVGYFDLSSIWLSNGITPSTTGYLKIPLNITLGTNFSISFWYSLESSGNGYPNVYNVGFFSLMNDASKCLVAMSNIYDGATCMITTGATANIGQINNEFYTLTSSNITGQRVFKNYGGTYAHYCITFDGSGTQFYVNGILAKNLTHTLYSTFLTQRVTHINLGYSVTKSAYYGTGSPYFNGYIDDFRFYKRTLSFYEARSLYALKSQ